jgi:hypothetical protein
MAELLQRVAVAQYCSVSWAGLTGWVGLVGCLVGWLIGPLGLGDGSIGPSA